MSVTPSSRRPARRIVIGLGSAAVAVAVVAVALVLRDDGPSPAVSVGGWSGHAIQCGYREQADALGELAAGAVLELDDLAPSVLADANCNVVPRAAKRAISQAPTLRPGHAYFAVNTGHDRYNVALVDVELGGPSPRLDAEVIVPGDGCSVTADYRGQLMLLIEAPEGSPLPRVTLRTASQGC